MQANTCICKLSGPRCLVAKPGADLTFSASEDPQTERSAEHVTAARCRARRPVARSLTGHRSLAVVSMNGDTVVLGLAHYDTSWGHRRALRQAEVVTRRLERPFTEVKGDFGFVDA